MKRTDAWTPATLVTDVPRLTHTGSTTFMRWGPVVGWIALVLAVVQQLRSARRGPGVAVFTVGVTIGFGTGCASVELPYDLEAVEPRSVPRHPLRVAVLPLVDARSPDERPSADGRFVYRRTEYRGTVMDDLRGRPVDRVTEVLARHLARRRVFAQIVLVRRAEQASDADLYLEGRIRRLRGYVEANPPPEESGRPLDERKTLAEVLLEDLRLRTKDGQVRLHVDAGWSRVDTVRTTPPPEPWPVMSAALRVALDQLCALIDDADLSGGFEVRDRVGLAATTSSVSRSAPFGDLATDGPYGWRYDLGPSSAPTGWRGPPTCAQAVFTWRQTRRFHRATGPYRPRVRLWACPVEAPFRFDGAVPFAAERLGVGPGGRYFIWTLGETNWPRAAAELRHRLRVRAADRRP